MSRYFVSHGQSPVGPPHPAVYGPGSNELKAFPYRRRRVNEDEDRHWRKVESPQWEKAHYLANELNAGGARKERALRRMGK